MAKVDAQQSDVNNFDIGTSDVALQSLGEDNRIPLPGSKFQLLDSEGLSLDERLTVDEARELQRNLEKLMEEGGDLDAVTLSNSKIRIPPHVVMSTLHPNDLSVERRIHEAYKDQRFVGRDFETEAPYSAKATVQPRARIPQRSRTTTTTPSPEPKSTTKRAFVVRKRKKAEALAARARQMAKHKDCFMSQNWNRKFAALRKTK